MSYIYPFTKATKERFGVILSSPYGLRIFNGEEDFHHGVDLRPTIDRDGDISIIATVDGTLYNYVDIFGGLTCRIINEQGVAHVTIHHKKFLKPHLAKVRVGDEIALMGTSGKSTGVHVHYEIQLKSGDRSTTIDPLGDILYFEDTSPMQKKYYQIKMNKVKIVESEDHADIDSLYKVMKAEDDSGKDVFIRMRRVTKEGDKVINDEKIKGFKIKKA